MTSIVNGLNFRRNFYGNDVARIDVEQVLRLKKQRILDKESENSNEILIKTLCDVKQTYNQSKVRAPKTTGISNCTCWYMYNEFLTKDVQDSMECDGCGEINIFNTATMNRLCSFLKQGKELVKFSDPVTWDMFFKNDSVNRLIYDVSEEEILDIMDEERQQKIADEKWVVLKKYFDYFSTHCNEYFLNLLSKLCRKSISTFNINGFDLALLHSLQYSDKLKPNEKRPIIYIIKCRCLMDYLLVPLLFKEAGIDQPVCIVGESPEVLKMRPTLGRLGYLIVRKESQLKFSELQSFVVEKKTSMILEAQRPICLVLNDSLNSYIDSTGEPTEIKVLTTVVNSFVDGKLNDPILIPLSFCHEYIPNGFLTQSQSSWLPNSWMFLSMISGQFGVVKLSICKPIYYSQCMGAPEGTEDGAQTNPKMKISSLIKHFSWFGTESQLVMPTNLVAFLVQYYYRGKSAIPVEEMALIAIDLIQDILPSDTLAFQESSMLTIIRRGCNVLSHLLTVDEDRNNKSQFTVSVDCNDFKKMSELDFYADVVVNQILLKAVVATAFVSVTQFTPSMQYVNQLTASSDEMNDAISNITKLLLSRHFQFYLPCKSLDGEICKTNNWWNEAMITSTRATDSLCIDNDYNNKEYKKISNESLDWRADVYDKRIRRQIMLLSSCLAPRLESMDFLVAELMLDKQIGFESMTLCSELYQKFLDSTKKASKLSRLRFKCSTKSSYFISALITLNTHEIVKIMDLSTRSWMVLASDVDLLSSRYAVLDSEYYNLQRWKTYIDVALVAA